MKLVDAVAPEASAEVATAWFTALVRAAMVPAGAARWRMSWAGQLELVMPDGEIFDAESLAAELADSSTARDAAARLTALGVDVAAVGPVSHCGGGRRRRRRRHLRLTRAHPASTR